MLNMIRDIFAGRPERANDAHGHEILKSGKSGVTGLEEHMLSNHPDGQPVRPAVSHRPKIDFDFERLEAAEARTPGITALFASIVMGKSNVLASKPAYFDWFTRTHLDHPFRLGDHRTLEKVIGTMPQRDLSITKGLKLTGISLAITGSLALMAYFLQTEGIDLTIVAPDPPTHHSSCGSCSSGSSGRSCGGF